jgi:hypothetical protein
MRLDGGETMSVRVDAPFSIWIGPSIHMSMHSHPRGTIPSLDDYKSKGWVWVVGESDGKQVFFVADPARVQAYVIPVSVVLPPTD